MVHAEVSPPSTHKTHKPQQQSNSAHMPSQTHSRQTATASVAIAPTPVQATAGQSGVAPSLLKTSQAGARAGRGKSAGAVSNMDITSPDEETPLGRLPTGLASGGPKAGAGSGGLPDLAHGANRQDTSPGEAAVTAAFALAGCIAQDLAPDSAEEVSDDCLRCTVAMTWHLCALVVKKKILYVQYTQRRLLHSQSGKQMAVGFLKSTRF